MIRIAADQLTQFVADIFVKSGCSIAESGRIVDPQAAAFQRHGDVAGLVLEQAEA